jgi:predicted short-subunit dehydrogenase-like oxidoreductase (DUF2520 family)
MNAPLSISIIGFGNVGYHLALAFSNLKGHYIKQIYVRNKSSLNSETFPVKELSKNSIAGDLIILAIPDDQIESVLMESRFPDNSMVVHTSGATDIAVFQNKGIKNFGVLYPLQTFSRSQSLNYSDIELFIEANDPDGLTLLERVGRDVFRKVTPLSSKERLNLHLSAVFACNFTNHMFSIAERILSRQKSDLSRIHPLITETIHKAMHQGAFKAQTGPAQREDWETMKKHINLIDDPETRELYHLISQSIIRSKKENKS